MHGGDRNRTSPFAFTGNKFEFRALGSRMSLGAAQHGAQHDRRRGDRRARRRSSRPSSTAGTELDDGRHSRSSRRPRTANKQIVFDGDGYSEEWHAEAEKRGLLQPAHDARRAAVARRRADRRRCSRSTACSPSASSRRATRSLVEQYVIKLNIEAETAASIARTMILPAAVRHLDAAQGGRRRGPRSTRPTPLVDELVEAIVALEEANDGPPGRRGRSSWRKYMRDTVIAAMDGVRDGRRQAREASSPTTSGRCRSTRRCCSSSSRRRRTLAGSEAPARRGFRRSRSRPDKVSATSVREGRRGDLTGGASSHPAAKWPPRSASLK